MMSELEQARSNGYSGRQPWQTKEQSVSRRRAPFAAKNVIGRSGAVISEKGITIHGALAMTGNNNFAPTPSV